MLNGKIMNFECTERTKRERETVKTYYCTGVRDVACLMMNEHDVVILVNPNFEKANGAIEVEMRYIYFLLCDYFGEYLITDLCMSSYFGIIKTMKFIKETGKANKEITNKRISALENMLRTNKQYQIISKENLLNLYNSIELREENKVAYEEVS